MWDLPFGLGLAEWDAALLTRRQFQKLFSTCDVLSTNPNYCVLFYCIMGQAGELQEEMKSHGFSNIQSVFVYKPENNCVGVNCFINAVEVLVMGWRTSRAKSVVDFPEANPTMRHNMFFAPNVRGKLMDEKGVPVNTTQKPTLTSFRFAQRFVRAGGKALVIGAGSGSDMIGMAYAGVSVVGVEKDPRQCDLIRGRLATCMAPNGVDFKRFQVDLTKMDRMHKFCNLNMAVTREEATELLKGQMHFGTNIKEMELAVDADRTCDVIEHDECVACSEDIKMGDLAVCDWCGAGAHRHCRKKCKKCSTVLCGMMCRRDHICPGVTIVEEPDEELETGEGMGGPGHEAVRTESTL